MRWVIGLPLLLAATACERSEPPADRIVETAEQIVDPAPSPPAPWAAGRFAPRDECPEVEGASAFRSRLAASVRDRDAAALAGLAASDIKLDFGGGAGADELRRRLSEPDTPLWHELEELLPLGCAANAQGGITLPWVAGQELPIRDPGAAMLVTGPEVPVLEEPRPDAATIGTVSWDVVAIDGVRPDAPFQQVVLPDGSRGYMASGALRSMLDYRLTAARRNGRWSITSFVAGD